MADIDLITERLAMRGHRLTPSRKRVLDAVFAQPAPHFSVDDVLRAAPATGRATVFRTMKLLTDLNVVCRVLLEDGTLHYRLSARGHHHHLVCRDCGRVEDFSNCDVGALVAQLAQATDYDIEGHWLEVYGRCAGCRDRAGAEVRGGGQRQRAPEADGSANAGANATADAPAPAGADGAEAPSLRRQEKRDQQVSPSPPAERGPGGEVLRQVPPRQPLSPSPRRVERGPGGEVADGAEAPSLRRVGATGVAQ